MARAGLGIMSLVLHISICSEEDSAPVDSYGKITKVVPTPEFVHAESGTLQLLDSNEEKPSFQNFIQCL